MQYLISQNYLALRIAGPPPPTLKPCIPPAFRTMPNLVPLSHGVCPGCQLCLCYYWSLWYFSDKTENSLDTATEKIPVVTVTIIAGVLLYDRDVQPFETLTHFIYLEPDIIFSLL